MNKEVTATEAARSFSDLLNRVCYGGETFDVIRGGKIVARLVAPPSRRRITVRDLLGLFSRLEDPDDAMADDLVRIQAEQPELPGDAWDS